MKCEGWRRTDCDLDAEQVVRWHWEGATWFPSIHYFCEDHAIECYVALSRGTFGAPPSGYRAAFLPAPGGERAPFVNDGFCMRCGLAEERCRCLTSSAESARTS